MSKSTYIALTIQNAGLDNYRFGVSACDSRSYFMTRGQEVKIIFSKTRFIFTKTSCGVKIYSDPLRGKDKFKRKKGYDFNSTCIDYWVKQKSLHLKIGGKRKKAIFELKYHKDYISLTYIRTGN